MKKKKVTLSRKETPVKEQEELATTMIRQARERCRFERKKMKMREKEMIR